MTSCVEFCACRYMKSRSDTQLKRENAIHPFPVLPACCAACTAVHLLCWTLYLHQCGALLFQVPDKQCGSCVSALKNARLLGKLHSARRYVKSRSDPQLQGQIATLSSLKNCEPELYQGSHNESLRIDPCGLIAWSFFNDTYQVGLKSTQFACNSA